MRKTFESPDHIQGSLEISFPGESSGAADKELLAGDEGFLLHLATLIIGAISRHQLGKLLYDHTERKKELKGIRQTAETLDRQNSLEESLQEVCSFLPDAWQYPEYTWPGLYLERACIKATDLQRLVGAEAVL